MKPKYNPAKTALLEYTKQNNGQSLKSALTISTFNRPDLNNFFKILYYLGLTLTFGIGIIKVTTLHNKFTSLNKKMTDTDILTTVSLLMATAFFMILNNVSNDLLKNQLVADPNIKKIINKKLEHPSLLKELLTSENQENLTVEKYLMLIDRIMPVLDQVSRELRRFANHHEETPYQLSHSAYKTLIFWNSLTPNQQSKYYEPLIEQDFSRIQFESTYRY